MQRLEYETKDLKQQGVCLVTADGLTLHEDSVKQVLKFNSLPETLVNIDKKYELDTTMQVLTKKVSKISLLVEEKGDEQKVQILDPKSHFLEDDEFQKVIDTACSVLEMQPSKDQKQGFEHKTAYRFAADTDVFFKDAYHKAFEITRLPQGGLYFSVGLLRLACTNGAVAHDKELQHLMRQGRYDESVILAFANRVREMNLDTYFKGLFMHKGEYLQASVADYLAMRDCIKNLVDEDYADLLYPTDQIKIFYADQDINIDEISRTNLHRLPSGIRYYEAFNILTNGAKQAEATIANQIEVARFSSVAKLRQLKDSNITFHGAPKFDPISIARRMGDIQEQ